jgi:hypothetical protein
MSTAAKTAITDATLDEKTQVYEYEHPTEADLERLADDAHSAIAHALWQCVSDRDGVLNGLVVTQMAAGPGAGVAVQLGSLIVAGNIATRPATADFPDDGTLAANIGGTVYIHARASWEDTDSEARAFVVTNKPRIYRGIGPAAGETPDGSKVRFELQHTGIMREAFFALVDSVPVPCTMSSGTGTGGVDEAVFADAPAAGTSVTFVYAQQVGGFGTTQNVYTKKTGVVELLYSTNAVEAGYVLLATIAVVPAGPAVANGDIADSREFLFHYDSLISWFGPGGYKKIIDFLYYLERADTLAEYLPAVYTSGFDVEPSNGYQVFTGNLVNLSQSVIVSNQAMYDGLKAGMTIFFRNVGDTDWEDLDGDGYYDPYRILTKSDSGGGGGTIVLDTAYLGATRAVQVNNRAFVRMGSMAKPLGEVWTQRFKSNDLLHQLAYITRGFFYNVAPWDETAFPYYSGADDIDPAIQPLFHNFAPVDMNKKLIEYVRVRVRKGVKQIRVMIHAGYFKTNDNIKLTAFMGRVSDPVTEPTWGDATERIITFAATTVAGWYQFDDAGGVTLANDLVFDDALTEDEDVAVVVVAEKLTNVDGGSHLYYAGLQVYEILIP